MVESLLASSQYRPLLSSFHDGQISLQDHQILLKRIMLEIQTILQKILQTANVVNDYW